MFLTSLMISSAVAATPGSVRTIDGLAWEIAALEHEIDDVLIVGVEDPDAERIVRRLEREISGEVIFIPMRPSAVDANSGRWTVEHVLRVRGEGCGMLVRGASSVWAVDQVGGRCSDPAPLAVVAQSGPTELATGTAGVTVFIPNPTVKQADPGYLRAYQRQSLYRGIDYGGPWGVYDGWGRAMNTREFAKATGDDFTLDRLRRERFWSVAGGAALAGVGTAMIIGAGYIDQQIQPYEIDVGPFEMPGANHGDRRNRALTGAGITAVGLVIPLGVNVKQRSAANYYSGLEADLAIERYNDDLRRSWSLSEEAVRDLDPLQITR